MRRITLAVAAAVATLGFTACGGASEAEKKLSVGQIKAVVCVEQLDEIQQASDRPDNMSMDELNSIQYGILMYEEGCQGVDRGATEAPEDPTD